MAVKIGAAGRNINRSHRHAQKFPRALENFKSKGLLK
jgi:hypothetical protein